MGIGDWGRHLFYSSIDGVSSAITRASAARLSDTRSRIDDNERMKRIHLTALFIGKVMAECARYGVTPWSEDTHTINLEELLTEAEQQLGLACPDELLSAMSYDQRDEIRRLSRERRQHAYSAFIRQTSEPAR